MSRTIELIHAGRWTSTQVVRLVQRLVCPTCTVHDIDLETTADPTASRERADLPQVRIGEHTIAIGAATGGPSTASFPGTPRGAGRPRP
jgi:hypothetical protein